MEALLDSFSDWFSANKAAIFNILAIIIVAWLIKRFGQIVIKEIVIKTIESHHHESPEAEKKREETIIQIISGALNIVIWPITLIIIVGQLGVDIAPLVAGAGILGVALGFGTQSLVKDVIAGSFIIIENQYRVGDIVNLDGTSGMVERITLRVTVLRDLDGVVHHVPNGSIQRAANQSKDYSGINFDISVAFDSDIDKVTAIINEVGQTMTQDSDWQTHILEAPQFFRINTIDEKAVDIKITGKVAPLKQWAVTGEMRKRLKKAFNKASIEMHLPKQTPSDKSSKSSKKK